MREERLIEAKKRWAEKAAAKGVERLSRPTGERLPPGQHLTRGFPVLDLGIQPEINLQDWVLKVGGRVDKPLLLDWAAFNRLPQIGDTSDFHCVTTWSKFDCRWEGVAFTEIYERVKARPEAKYVFFTGFDGYTVNVPLDILLDDDVLIATRFEGEPLARKHGGPARVIIPKLYAWKGAKFVREITFMVEDKLGFWEVRGYSNTADPFTEDRYG